MTRPLDDDLALVAPPLRERTPQLGASLNDLIADTERIVDREVASAARRRRTFAAAALTGTVLLGAGTTAAAVGWTPTPWWSSPESTEQPLSPDPDIECSVTYAPRAVDDPAHPVSDEDRAAATSAAAQYLQRFDYDTIEDNDFDTQYEMLNAGLESTLRQRGLSTYAVSVAFSTDCPVGGDR